MTNRIANHIPCTMQAPEPLAYMTQIIHGADCCSAFVQFLSSDKQAIETIVWLWEPGCEDEAMDRIAKDAAANKTLEPEERTRLTYRIAANINTRIRTEVKK